MQKYTDADVDKLLGALEAKQTSQQVKLQPYTVLMVLPDYLAHGYGVDTYLAHVEAENVEQAQKEGQKEALYEMVPDDTMSDYDPEDFFVCFVCEGHMADIHIW